SYTIDQLREFKRELCTEITTKKDANVVEDIHFHSKELRDALLS
ncbi:hypothetical protein L195_g010960, partial [Trifolium pratense]